ncbi:MAG: YggT family protein [Chloroflexi bacterium]|nr:YggT family protein [Chloroflexota bacterium]MCL5109411.1 YggT family protein [Chloroflexota bacterium]
MTQSDEPRAVGPQEPVVVVERTTPPGDPTPAAAGLDYAERTEQATRSTAGVEQRERVVTDAAGLQSRARVVRDVGAEQRLNLHTVSQVILLLFGIVEALIGLRVILKLIGANPDNEFARTIYNAAALFLAPFFGLVGSPAAGGMVLEVPSLFAMLVYALLGWLLISVVWPLFERPTTTSTSTYDRYER